MAKPEKIPRPDQYWDKKQAATFLSKTVRAIETMAYRRELPFYKVGRLLRFDPDELANWVRQERREPL